MAFIDPKEELREAAERSRRNRELERPARDALEGEFGAKLDALTPEEFESLLGRVAESDWEKRLAIHWAKSPPGPARFGMLRIKLLRAISGSP